MTVMSPGSKTYRKVEGLLLSTAGVLLVLTGIYAGLVAEYAYYSVFLPIIIIVLGAILAWNGVTKL